MPHDVEDSIIVAAVSGQADVICTLDRQSQNPDVQSFRAKRGIRIVTDIELLDLLREGESESNETKQ